jgi:hypothetical protein
MLRVIRRDFRTRGFFRFHLYYDIVRMVVECRWNVALAGMRPWRFTRSANMSGILMMAVVLLPAQQNNLSSVLPEKHVYVSATYSGAVRFAAAPGSDSYPKAPAVTPKNDSGLFVASVKVAGKASGPSGTAESEIDADGKDSSLLGGDLDIDFTAAVTDCKAKTVGNPLVSGEWVANGSANALVTRTCETDKAYKVRGTCYGSGTVAGNHNQTGGWTAEGPDFRFSGGKYVAIYGPGYGFSYD